MLHFLSICFDIYLWFCGIVLPLVLLIMLNDSDKEWDLVHMAGYDEGYETAGDNVEKIYQMNEPLPGTHRRIADLFSLDLPPVDTTKMLEVDKLSREVFYLRSALDRIQPPYCNDSCNGIHCTRCAIESILNGTY
jgi:hypothetical protein